MKTKVDLSDQTSGVLPIANGGTAATTGAAALTALGGVANEGGATGLWIGSTLPATGVNGVLYVTTS